MINITILDKGTKVFILENGEVKVRFITDISVNTNATPMVRYRLSILNNESGTYYDDNLVFDNLENLKKDVNEKIDNLIKSEEDVKTKQEKT